MNPKVPSYVIFGEEPSELVFTWPTGCKETRLSEVPEEKYGQLIAWCALNSFWYYVVGSSAVTNEEFDYVKSMIAFIEHQEEEGEIETLGWYSEPQEPLGFSPTKRGYNPCRHIPSRYPCFIVQGFSEKNIPFNPRLPEWMSVTLEKLKANSKKKESKNALEKFEFTDD